MLPKIAIIAADTEDAKQSRAVLKEHYPIHTPQEADILVVLGGDGALLDSFHRYGYLHKPFYGMNRGSVGFLMNPYTPENLKERLYNAQQVRLSPLIMIATTKDGRETTAIAYNEVALFRETRQAAKIQVHIDGKERLSELICDGILLSTPAGSTAYNLSAHGPIIPLNSNILAMTPISAFRPRRWRGALIPAHNHVSFTILEPVKRPVSATADFTEIRDVRSVTIIQDKSQYISLLSDPDHNLEERILKEQFET